MVKSLRERIIDLLMDNSLTAKEICVLLDLEPNRIKEVHSNIEKIAKIVKRKGLELFVMPPKCKNCGFEFSKIKASKCPKCKSERIEEARFVIR
ncbi:transcriptional regulator [Archaeoglobales archaeon]|nr:MAG: transcriptional regulator [Archaeoglobales archaeon]